MFPDPENRCTVLYSRIRWFEQSLIDLAAFGLLLALLLRLSRVLLGLLLRLFQRLLLTLQLAV